MENNPDEQGKAPLPNTRLRAARNHLNFSQAELADRIRAKAVELGLNVACDEKRVGRWERGEVRTPSPVYRRVLCAVFDVENATDLGFLPPGHPDHCLHTDAGPDHEPAHVPTPTGNPACPPVPVSGGPSASELSAYAQGYAQGRDDALAAISSMYASLLDQLRGRPCQAAREATGTGARRRSTRALREAGAS